MKYIINNREYTKEEYIQVLEDLIKLANDSIPLEVNYIPVNPQPLSVVGLDKNIYRLLRDINVGKAIVNIYDNEPNESEYQYYQIIEVLSGEECLYLKSCDSEMYSSFVRPISSEDINKDFNAFDDYNYLKPKNS
jgi:hypothetical protein